MVTVHIYVEGSGPSDIQRRNCRQAFAEFFAASGIANKPRVVACGGRDDAYHDFFIAAKQNRPDVLPLLLVDSEMDVDPSDTPWQHLQKRDGWAKPKNVSDDQVFLMVQVMETWFLADHNALTKVFGVSCDCTTIPKWPNLEEVAKTSVFTILEKSTAKCKKKYAKGDVSFEVLRSLAPHKVESSCSHAKRLLDFLRKL